MQREAKKCFEGIAKETDALCEYLDIVKDPKEGAEKLTDIVSEQVLFSVGNEELVNAYRDKFQKCHV